MAQGLDVRGQGGGVGAGGQGVPCRGKGLPGAARGDVPVGVAQVGVLQQAGQLTEL